MSANRQDPEVLSSFLDEAGQCIATLNEKLLEAERGDAPTALVDEMFRAAHSMKGSAGFLNLADVASVTHSLETVLDWVRKGKLTFSDEVVDALFMAFDTASALLAQIAAGQQGEIDIAPSVNALEAVLGEREKPQSGEPTDELGPIPEWMRGHVDLDDVLETMIARNSGRHIYALRLPLREVFAREEDPILLYHALEHALQIQTAFAVLEVDSPWLPLGEYSYDVGLLCFSKSPIEQALSGVDLPVGRAWELRGGDVLSEPVFVGKAAGADLGERVDILEMRPEMEKHKATWVSETQEELEQLDAAVMEYEGNSSSRDILNKIFRLMHRLKGSCASMGFQEMGRIAHNAESMLSLFREKATPVPADAFSFFFNVKDFLNACLVKIQAGEKTAPGSQAVDAQFAALIAEVDGCSACQNVDGWSASDDALAQARDKAAEGLTIWKMALRLKSDTPLPDLRYLMILRDLEKHSDLLATDPSLVDLEQGIDNPPTLHALLAAIADENALRSVAQVDMVESLVFSMVDLPTAAVEPVSSAASAASSKEAGAKPASVSSVKEAAKSGAKASADSGLHADTVRVDTIRLDQMMNIAGELVITKARILQLSDAVGQGFAKFDLRSIESLLWFVKQVTSGQIDQAHASVVMSADKLRRLEQGLQSAREAQDAANNLRDTAIELHRHTSTMQNSVMKIRMVPIGPLFQRFHRLVRDLCKQRDRSARLDTLGESTELDKKLIDELTDPLTHLIRNGVDHGLESPADRIAAGKPEQGTVRLEAFHEGGQICVRVSDDGRGIDDQKIRAKAVSVGIIDQAAADRLTKEEAYQLIFSPGFSTAEKVTNISGRGVGMDIVKSKINELKGKIDIDTVLGKGTSFTIRLPLTLAMINALLVRIGQTRYAFPLEAVREIVDLKPNEINSVEGKGRVIRLRDQIISLVDLKVLMDADPLASESDVVRAVVVRGATENLAVCVDHVIGEEEVVVKALSEEVASARGISGATVLGDGGIALILDVGAIMELAAAGNGCVGLMAGEEVGC